MKRASFPRRRTVPASCGRGLRLIVLLGGLSVSLAQAQETSSNCGALSNAYGPYDYRSQRSKLQIVEQYHFDWGVESLLRGQSSSLGWDLDYTLRASPNHHRALLSLARWAQKTGSPQPGSLPRPIDCYFDRALRFRSEDTLARMIFAQHLLQTRRAAEAQQQLQLAREHAGNNGLSHYNIGLLYLEMGAHEEALQQAHKAQALGFGRIQPLKERLQAVGRWQEPPGSPAGTEPEAPPSSAARAGAHAPVHPAAPAAHPAPSD